MSKLLVGIVMTVLVLGACIYAMGTKVIPEIGNAGNSVKTSITEAFE
jgi:hypothetical protein